MTNLSLSAESNRKKEFPSKSLSEDVGESRQRYFNGSYSAKQGWVVGF